jgi:hypothetical protein
VKTIVQWLWLSALLTVVLSANEKTSDRQNVDTTRLRGMIAIQPISNIVAFTVVDGASTIESQLIETQQRTEKGSLPATDNEAGDPITPIQSYLSPINHQLLFLSTVTSFIGTLCLILLITRTVRSGSSHHANRKINDESLGFILPHGTGQRRSLPTRIPSEIDLAHQAVVVSTGRNNGAFTRRQSEEATLAMKFKQHMSTTATARKMGLLQNCAVLEDRVSFARKVGLAHGEIELALHLQKLQASIVQQGEQQ